MTRASWGLLLTLFSSTIFAIEPYDPYAVQKEDPPIRADGKLNWPPFFKSAATEAKFQEYFKTGSCVGTNMRIVNLLKDNKVNVNDLPETEVHARAVRVLPGIIVGQDAEGKSVLLVTHPKGVSQVDVSGEMSADNLGPGLTVRFTSQVNSTGHGVEPLTEVEVFTPKNGEKGSAVEADKRQAISGTIMQRRGNAVKIRVGEGKLKLLTMELSPSLKVHVDSHDLAHVAPGDVVAAKGLVYAGVGSAAARTIFSQTVTVTKGTAAK